MKKLLKLSFVFLFALGFNSCSDDDNDTLTGSAATGGLLNVGTPAVSYIQGSDAVTDFFTADLSVFQGNEKVESVDVYKQFFRQVDAATLVESNKVMLTTFNFPVVAQHEEHQISFNYNDLIADIVYEAAPLPADDSMLQIADYWIFSYVAHLTDGTSVHINSKTTKVTVSCGSFLAGNYVINYASGPQPIVVSELGGGLYNVDYFPTFQGVYWWQFSDVCGDLTITDWQYQGGNPISGTTSPMPHGVVNSDGSITFTGVNVGGISWYVDKTWTIYPN